ncbi:hypothetical protein [Gelidibacter salicanalis]|uniref:Uncharacterized protein n=1 Tax=Gelidibacter salicanalis TaxID=291193 RepID=A0A934KUF2_9FLAO|nr:hypothetical protein [Gelidibacter salicanalis]MBJ7880983.1 hypothetical protein [Gelidibacter salicanalis]
MPQGNNIEITGLKKTYISKEFLLTPFPDTFEYKKRICVFYSVLYGNEIERIYFIVEYFDDFTQDSLKNLDYKSFSPNGVIFLDSTKEDSKAIIDDIKSNKRLYKESFH